MLFSFFLSAPFFCEPYPALIGRINYFQPHRINTFSLQAIKMVIVGLLSTRLQTKLDGGMCSESVGSPCSFWTLCGVKDQMR